MGKREYKGLVIGTILILLLVPFSLCIAGFAVPVQYEDTFLGELKYKMERLQNTEGKRIILTGGSSVAFGVDSSLLEDAFEEYGTVNFGMYAGLGTTVMLELSEDEIRKGDVIILMPEQQPQTLSAYFNAEAMWQAADGAFSMTARLKGGSVKAMAGQFPYFAADKLSCFIRGKTPEPEGVYRRDSFDEYGDIAAGECSENTMPGGYDRNMPVSFDPAMLDEAFVEAVNEYVRMAGKKGAAVWYRFCPMNADAVEEGADVDAYYEYLQSVLDCPVIGNPYDCIMDSEWFYDTNFHLNSSGKIVNTAQLIRDIKAQLRDSSPTKIELPDKPASAETQKTEGDNRNRDSFLYAENNGTWTIIGLTEGGLKQDELVVPVSYEGMPVQSIAAGAFSGNPQLENVVIQENIRSVEDGAFDGCESLREIVMMGKNPEDVRVGQGLLEGTEAKIIVDQEAESEYKVNYFWSSHADRIQGR